MINYCALDIALPLPSEIENLSRTLNILHDAQPFSDFRKANNHPHITLALGVFRSEDVPTLVASLEKELSGDYCPLNLQITGLHRKFSDQIGQEYQLMIERNDHLLGLARGVWGIAHQLYASTPATREMIQLDANEVWEPNTTHWIERFRHKRFEDYNPHISLKCREAVLEEAKLPLAFVADKIVIARIGNYCTSRDIVNEISLRYKE